jgi:exosortase/archaeosortase family protein
MLLSPFSRETRPSWERQVSASVKPASPQATCRSSEARVPTPTPSATGGEAKTGCLRALPRRDVFLWAAAILFLNHLYAVTGPDGWGVVIISSCSSFHNLSLAMLCWLTVSRWRHQDWQARDFVIGAAIGVTMILFNVVRICLMSWDHSLYHYWHDGPGAEAYAVGASLTILLLSLSSARPAGHPA